MKIKRINKKERKRKNLIEYTKTVIFTLFAITILIGAVVYDVAIAAHSKMSSIMEQIIDNFKTQTIEDLKEQARRYPNDYRINMKLAGIYEEINENFKAEEEYKKALFKSPRNPQVLYRYALLCVYMGRFDEGIVLIENISDSAKKDTILKKLSFYQYAGDKLFEKGDYWNATKVYILGAKYGKILGGPMNEKLKQNLVRAALLSADKLIDENNPEQARLALEGVLKYYDSSEARYKLALLDLGKNPEQAVGVMLDLMEKDPQLVNYNLLYSTLKKLSEETTDENKLKYYVLKMSKVKASAMKNALYSDEFKIENPRITETKGTFGKKIMSFDVRNVSGNEIGNVHLQVNIQFPNAEPFTREATVSISEDNEAHASVLINSWEHLEKYHGNAKDAKVEIYGRKNNRFDWVLLDKINVPIEKI